MIVDLYFDGGCRANPNGPAAGGAVVRDLEGRTLRHVGRHIGIGTNNSAEWTGFLIGLEAARDVGATCVRAFGDSNLVVQQFARAWGINEEHLLSFAQQAWTIAKAFPDGVTTAHVPREQNRAADAICTAVLEDVYVPDAEIDEVLAAADLAAAVATPISVSFVVDVTLDRNAVRTALAAGVKPTELRKQLAKRYENRLLLAGQLPDEIRVSRVKG
jgi:ribonuclease HI